MNYRILIQENYTFPTVGFWVLLRCKISLERCNKRIKNIYIKKTGKRQNSLPLVTTALQLTEEKEHFMNNILFFKFETSMNLTLNV